MSDQLKILSGGQSGADRAAMVAANDLGLESGGWCPPGRASESGMIPHRFPLIETPVDRSPEARDIPHSLRTFLNVRDAEAILILTCENSEISDPGTLWTLVCVKKSGKPFLILNPWDTDSVLEIRQWIVTSSIRLLNVAGPRESSCPGIYDQSYRCLIRALAAENK